MLTTVQLCGLDYGDAINMLQYANQNTNIILDSGAVAGFGIDSWTKKRNDGNNEMNLCQSNKRVINFIVAHQHYQNIRQCSGSN